jgi:hypothetical protein
MPHRVFSYVLMLLASAGCSMESDLSSRIGEQFETNGRVSVNLAEVESGSWERVCILGPYSDNRAARKMLGFDWNAERNTSIKTNDGISLLIFVEGDRVAQYAEHSRARGDFTNLSGRCFRKEESLFVQIDSPSKGWPGLFPK